jgi:hypothetical protein
MVAGQQHDAAVDVLGLGVLLYELLVCSSPFEGNSEKAVCRRIKVVDVRFPGFVPVFALGLIVRFLRKDPGSQSISMKEGTTAGSFSSSGGLKQRSERGR